MYEGVQGGNEVARALIINFIVVLQPVNKLLAMTRHYMTLS